MAPSPRHTRTLSDQQREAILKAVLIDGHKPAEVRRMAAAGQLDVPAFELGHHVYTVLKRGRETYEATNDQALANSTREQLKRLHRLNLKKARATSETSDPAEIARIAKALAETERAYNTNAPRAKTPKPQPDHGAEPQTNPSPGVLQMLQALVPASHSAARANGAANQPASQAPTSTTGRGPVRSGARSATQRA